MAIKSITRKVVRTERPTDLSAQLDRSNPLNRGLYKALLFGEGDEPLDLLNHGGTVFTGADHDGNVIGLVGKGINFTAQRNTGVDSDLYPNQSGDFSAICVVEPSSLVSVNVCFYQGSLIDNGFGAGANVLEIHFAIREGSADFIAQDGSIRGLCQVIRTHELGNVYTLGGVKRGRDVTAYVDGISSPTTDNDANGIASAYVRLADVTDTAITRHFLGKQYLFLSWSRALSNEEMKSLTLNPWQLYEPETETIFFSDVAALQLIVQSLNHSQSIDNINLVQANVLTLNELNHSQALDNVTVNQSINLAVQELAHALSMDNPALVQANVIIVQELLHNHLIDTPALTQANTLAPDPLDHQQLLDNIDLTQAGILTVEELNHLFSMDTPVLTQANVLTVQGSDHSQSLDNIDLLSGVSLIVQRMDQAQVIDNVSLTQSQFIEIQDAVHAVLFDSPALNQSNVLSVDELNQSHLIDNVVLTQASTLIVSDLLHAYFLDNIDFATGIIRTQNERVFIVKRKERTFIIAKPYRDNLQ